MIVQAPSTRQKLVETAARLFHAQGFAATGVAQILRESGANPGSFYHVFPSKLALLEAVLDWYADHLRPIVLDPIESSQPDPIERIFDLLAWYRDGLVQSGCRLGCPIGNLALEVSDIHPEARPGIDLNLRNWARGIRAWLVEAADRLPPDCDRHALSLFVLTAMEGGLMQARAASSLEPYDACIRVVRDYFNRLLDAAGDERSRKGGADAP